MLRLFLLLLLTIAVGSCAAPHGRDLAPLAQAAGVHEQLVEGRDFRHRLFSNPAAMAATPGEVLLVFLEGDGTPWSHGGRRAASDPTPVRPLAFELFLRTSQPAWYITRPCYNGLRDAACEPALWTSGRYSTTVLDSLATALRSRLQQRAPAQVVLVGYSGGGTLATLLAKQLPASGVVSIAANLDVAAWTRLHGYLPLEGSLDPARQPPLEGVAQVLLTGGRDTQVPASSVAEYLRLNPQAAVLPYADFDHRCCWVEQWQQILPVALRQVAVD